jgi:dihydroorotate dehydrogenase/NAD-dependent dihydropyrimidine dehydrogenase PreA subunit
MSVPPKEGVNLKNFYKILRNDMAKIHNFLVSKEEILTLCQIFWDHFESIRNNYLKNDLKRQSMETFSWKLAEEINDKLNISLQSRYFGTKIAHPFIAAPAKHTREGTEIDYSRLIRLRIIEGWAAIVPKTVIGSDIEGKCSLSSNLGDAYFPPFTMIDKNNFQSAERGSHFSLDEYLPIFKENVELGKSAQVPIIGSILAGFPVQSYEEEWTHTLKKISECTKFVELDYSPTITKSSDSENLKDYTDTVENNIDRILNVLKLGLKHNKQNKFIAISPKITPELHPHLNFLINQIMEKKLSIDGSISLILFNRKMGILSDPNNFLPINSAFGGEGLYLSNLASIYNFYASKNKYKSKCRLSYTGGITDGIKAANIIASGNVDNIQVASSLMFHGGSQSLFRLLGGLSIYLLHLNRFFEKNNNIDVNSIQNLAGLFHNTEIQKDKERFLNPTISKNKFKAVLKEEICKGSCKATNFLFENQICPAGQVCPTYAIKRPKMGNSMGINSNLCIGCGNCVEFCQLKAISLKKL